MISPTRSTRSRNRTSWPAARARCASAFECRTATTARARIRPRSWRSQTRSSGKEPPLARIEATGRDGEQGLGKIPQRRREFKSAELLYTEDDGTWKDRRWKTSPATVDEPAKYRKRNSSRPAATVYYLNLIDERKLIVSTEHEETAPKAKDKVFVGYLYGHPRHINFKLYTHLCHAFLVADEDGNVRTDRNVPSRDLTGQGPPGRRQGLAVAGRLGLGQAVRVDRFQARIRGSLRQVGDRDRQRQRLRRHRPRLGISRHRKGSRRLRAARAALPQGSSTKSASAKGQPMLVTMAASSNAGTLKWLGKDFLLETMDWINVMTYDYTGDWTNYAGHHSPLFASSKQPGAPRSTALTMKYLLEERGLPADRLAVGIPLYGRGFAVAEPYASTKDAPKTGVPARRLQQSAPARAREGLDAHLGQRDPATRG